MGSSNCGLFNLPGDNTAIGLSNTLKIAAVSSNAVGRRMEIGFDQFYGSTYSHSVIGQIVTDRTSFETGDLYFATKGGTTDVAPTERMRITSGGNVGIGTNDPAAHLHLYKASGATTVLTEVNSNSTLGYEIKKTGTTTQHWKIVDGQTVNGVLEFYDATDSLTRMAIDGNGNVGINDSSPTYKLDVNGTFRVTGASVLSTISSNLNPTTNSTYNLGENTNRWANIFADTLYGAGSNITALNATNLSSGTVNTARLGTGTADSSTFLRGDNTWVANASGTVTSITAGSGLSGGTITTSGTIANTDKGSSQNIFKKVRTSNSVGNQLGLSTANSNDDTIDFRQGTGITLATSGDVVTITATNTTVGTVTSSGTAGYIPRLSTNTNIANSIIYEETGKILLNGTTALGPFGDWSWTPTFQQLGTQGIASVRCAADVYGGALQLVSARGSNASPTIVLDNDRAGGVYFHAYDGVDFRNSAGAIECFIDGTPGADDTPGRLVFSTTPDGSNSFTEQMTIKSDGNVGIGTTDPSTLFESDVDSASTGIDSITARNKGVTTIGHTVGYRYQFNSAVPAASRAIIENVNSGLGRLGLFVSTDAALANLTEYLSIKSDGNVGIGTTAPNFAAASGNTVKGLNIQNVGNDTQASLRLTGHNNTGTPGADTYTGTTSRWC